MFDTSPVRQEYLIRGSCVVAKGVFAESQQRAHRTAGAGRGLAGAGTARGRGASQRSTGVTAAEPILREQD